VRKILPNARAVCVTLLILSSISCNRVKWTWKAEPYSADHLTKSLYGSGEEVVSCEDIRFSEFTCFDYEDMEELVFNIKRLKKTVASSNISRKSKRRFNYQANKLLSKLPRGR